MDETIKEFSSIDGAFIIRATGWWSRRQPHPGRDYDHALRAASAHAMRRRGDLGGHAVHFDRDLIEYGPGRSLPPRVMLPLTERKRSGAEHGLLF